MDLFSVLIHDMLLLLAVINPFGNIPVYVDLTKEFDRRQRAHVMNLAVMASFFMVVVFATIGDWCLKHLFAVTLNEFKIAGGILLLIVAVRGVMTGLRSYAATAQDHRSIAIFPLAFPVITGPGTLVVTIILAQKENPFIMSLVSLMTFLVVFLIARNAGFIMKWLGKYAALIIPRLLYIFLAAKAVSLILEGISGFVKNNFNVA